MQSNDYLINYYNEYDEEGRLANSRVGKVEYLTTRKYIDELLKPDSRIAEIGAGTGRYSVTLAKEGYDVTAVELVQHNLDILVSKLDGSEGIKTYQGNALDLNMLTDNTFDITLVLGPMYHLYSDEEKITALREAIRITKPGGHILVAYCMNEATVIQYVFGCNQLRSVMGLNMLTDDWKCISEPKDLFEMVRVEDIQRINAAVPVERVYFLRKQLTCGIIPLIFTRKLVMILIIKRRFRFMRRFVYKHQKTGDYKMDYIYRYNSPIGFMTMASNGASFTGLWFEGNKTRRNNCGRNNALAI